MKHENDAFADWHAIFRRTATTTAQTTARSDADVDTSTASSNERGDTRTHTASRAFDAVSVLILRCASPLVRRAAVVRSRHDSRLSGQALTAIILIATIGFCVLLGCVLQLPAALITLRNRFNRSRRTASNPGSSNNIFDVEMGDQEENLGPLAWDGRSPPPPYSRAPSYESSGENTGTGGREERTS